MVSWVVTITGTSCQLVVNSGACDAQAGGESGGEKAASDLCLLSSPVRWGHGVMGVQSHARGGAVHLKTVAMVVHPTRKEVE